MSSVLEIINGGTGYLEKRGIEDARRNMQLLLAHHLGCGRMDLYVQFDRPLEEAQLVPLREALKKRGEGVPLQHLLGSVVFHGREFRCDGRALIPRPETEELAGILLESVAWKAGMRVLDMGCGSGVLGLTLAAERTEAEVVLADVSPDALELARENAGKLGVERVRFVRSDLFSEVEGDFDLIVANLPYVPLAEKESLSREVRYDPELALFGGADGLDVIRRFVPEAAGRLRSGGTIALEIGHGQASQTADLLQSCGLAGVRVLRDLSGIDRFPIASLPA
jgi:release factor glutamine methyltransferase